MSCFPRNNQGIELFFMGFESHRTRGGLHLSQAKYASDLLVKTRRN